MSSLLQFPGSNIINSGKSQLYVPAVQNGLQGAWFFGGSLAKSLKNWAPGPTPNSLLPAATQGTGVPIAVQSNYASFGYTGVAGQTGRYLTTSIAETAGFSFMVIARSSASFVGVGGIPVFVSNYNTDPTQGNSPAGCEFLIGSTPSVAPAGTLSAKAGYKTPGGVVSEFQPAGAPIANATTFKLYSLTFDQSTQTMTSENLTDATETVNSLSTTVGTRNVGGTGPLYIGGRPLGAGGQGPWDGAAVFAWNRALSLAEKTTQAAQLRAYAQAVLNTAV